MKPTVWRWVVCVRDGAGGEDTIVGPFRSPERAFAYRRSIDRQIEGREGDGASAETITAIEPIYAAGELSASDLAAGNVDVRKL